MELIKVTEVDRFNYCLFVDSSALLLVGDFNACTQSTRHDRVRFFIRQILINFLWSFSPILL